MALAGSTAPDRRPSPNGLTLNLSSNNPFRNRALSPSPQASPHNSPWADSTTARSPRPMSTNPFLDAGEVQQPRRSADGASNARADNSNNAFAVPDDIFSDLSLLDKPVTNGATVVSKGAPPRSGPLPAQGPRPRDPMDRRAPPRPPRGPESPVKGGFGPPRQQRRASESSVMERPRITNREREDRPPRTESEERRRRERRREREERHKREKEKIRTGEKKHKKPQGLDIIDKLDVTGVYGQGLFHHDGPFDACNPHRNAKKDRRAPMQAFPVGSANMALGGAGPLNSRLDLDRIHGRGQEGFSEYAATRKADTSIIDPRQRVEPVHGELTDGLGTSTFLDGAPASKSALKRRDSEDPATQEMPAGGGLSRKKSLAQRFRGMSASRRYGPGDVRSPDARYSPANGETDVSTPNGAPQIKATSAGGPVRAKYTKENEVNPFENDYEAAFDKKGTQIKIAEQEMPRSNRPRAPSSPKQPALTRSVTSEARVPVPGRGSSNEEERPVGGGFLNRMRSLKGGPRRARNES